LHCVLRIETSSCLTVLLLSSLVVLLELVSVRCSCICRSFSFNRRSWRRPCFSVDYFNTEGAAVQLLCNSDHYIIINHRRRITVLRPRFGALFLLATRQVLLSYHLFIMLINWQMAGACGSGESSRRAYLVVALLTAKGIKFSAPHSAKRRLTTLPNLPVLSKEENYKLQDRPFTEN
jgi:hypothetical protein